MCKYILIISLLISFTSICLAGQTENKQAVAAEKDKSKKIEVGFFFGAGLHNFDLSSHMGDYLNKYWYWESAYGHTEYDLTASYSSSIWGHPKTSVGFGGFFNYFFHRDFGFQFMLERSHHNVDDNAGYHIYNELEYSWGESDFYSAWDHNVDATVRLIVMPISFNGIFRINGGEYIGGYASGGLTYYKADIEAASIAGYSFSYLWHEYDSDLYYLLYDMVLIPVSIDDSFGGIGGNVGVGVFLSFWEKFGIVADFRYYHAPEKHVPWAAKAGDYTYLINDWYGPLTKTVTQSDIDTLFARYEGFAVEVNPSFFQFAFGLQFRF